MAKFPTDSGDDRHFRFLPITVVGAVQRSEKEHRFQEILALGTFEFKHFVSRTYLLPELPFTVCTETNPRSGRHGAKLRADGLCVSGGKELDRNIMGEHTSHFARPVLILGVLYLVVLFLTLLLPFDFSSPFATRENTATWVSKEEGVAFGQSGMLISAATQPGLYRGLTSGEGLTIELWLKTASAHQSGVARIVSYSLNLWERNFTVGQDGHDLIFRLRTTRTDADGEPSLDVAGVFLPGRMQHIVVTYDFAETRVYIDGRLRALSGRAEGGFGTWDSSQFLVFGYEVSGARPWNGSIAYTAIYDRVVPSNVISVRHETGPRPANMPPVLLAYDFTRGLNDAGEERDTAGTISPTRRLEKPARVALHARLFFLYSGGKMRFGQPDVWDLTRNVILFLPFGVFGFSIARQQTRSAVTTILATIAAATIVSATCEGLQFFQGARSSSILDVGTNVAGALVGVLGSWIWRGRLLQHAGKSSHW